MLTNERTDSQQKGLVKPESWQRIGQPTKRISKARKLTEERTDSEQKGLVEPES